MFALEIAAEIEDWVTDVNDGWTDLSAAERLECARDFAKICSRLSQAGYVCHMGRHWLQTRMLGGKRCILSGGFVAVLPAAAAHGTRYALVELEGDWEIPEEHLVALPPNAAP
jgi:hypothetical protein